jgi:EmrB/QacA subfamily drug resistance transporter
MTSHGQTAPVLESQPAPPRSGSPGAAALALIAAAQLMVVLDTTVINVALPSIHADLHMSFSALGWVITAYTLAFASLLLPGSRLGDILGRRSVFMAGVGLFTAASLLGGLAPNGPILLIARGLQGAGAAVGAATALSLITALYRQGKERNRALAVYSAMEGAGGTLGLLLGGALVSEASWRYTLLINVPIGLIIITLTPRLIPRLAPNPQRLDAVGALLSAAGLGALVYGLSRAGVAGWTSPLTLAPLAAAVLLLPAFVAWEARTSSAIMPLWVWKNRTRAGGYLLMLLNAAALFAMFYFLTQYFQEVLGYSALKTGLAFLPLSIGILAAAGLASAAVTRIGPRPMTMVGTPLAAGGLYWLGQLNDHSTYAADVLPAMVVLAVGLGLMFVPTASAAVTDLPDERAGIGSGLLNTMMQVGASVAISALTTLSLTVFRHRQHADPGALHAALAAGYTSGLKVGAVIIAANFLVAALVLPRRTRTAPAASGTG